jgi:hypothetical protein
LITRCTLYDRNFACIGLGGEMSAKGTGLSLDRFFAMFFLVFLVSASAPFGLSILSEWKPCISSALARTESL